MILSYPAVNGDGVFNGAEVSFRFKEIVAIEHITKYVRHLREGGDSNVDHYEIVPGCIVIHLSRGQFDVQADYDELKAKLIQLNEWDE